MNNWYYDWVFRLIISFSGKTVFCEKPLALTEKGIEKCIAASKKYRKPLLCAFNRYFSEFGFRWITIF